MAASQAIQARYGRRAGWLRHHVAWTLDRLGAFAPLRRIRWDDVERLVFICRGNVCRSAYADARARLAGLRSASFGLAARDGDGRSEEHTSELQSHHDLVCRLLL